MGPPLYGGFVYARYSIVDYVVLDWVGGIFVMDSSEGLRWRELALTAQDELRLTLEMLVGLQKDHRELIERYNSVVKVCEDLSRVAAKQDLALRDAYPELGKVR
jgi:hypothetical protein